MISSISKDKVYYRYDNCSPSFNRYVMPYVLTSIGYPIFFVISMFSFSKSTQLIMTLSIFLICYYFISRLPFFKYQTVVIIRNIGIQTSTYSLLMPEIKIENNLVPFSNVKDIIITECFQGLQIIFALSILLKDFTSTDKKLIPILPGTNLKLDQLKEIRKNIEEFL